MPQTIYSCLKDDHQAIKRICREILFEESGASPKAQSKFVELLQLVETHVQAEEKTFYPLLQERAMLSESKRLYDLVLVAYEEHHVADLLLKEIQALNSASERWMAKMNLLQEILRHHFKQEEVSIFSNAREVLEVAELKTIADDFREKQERIKKQVI